MGPCLHQTRKPQLSPAPTSKKQTPQQSTGDNITVFNWIYEPYGMLRWSRTVGNFYRRFLDI